MNKIQKKARIYLIKDQDGQAQSVATSTVEARKQINWFLPKGNKYHYEIIFV